MSLGGIVESLPTSGRAYVCPLDKADDLPDLTFGANRIARFSAADLGTRLNLPRSSADLKIFERFTWLIVETPLFEPDPLDRLLSKPMNSDWAEIEPHRPRFTAAVESALFAVLLAPWEDWVDNDPGFWRPFEVPWIRRVGDDPSVRRQPPLSAATLSWDYSSEGEFIMPEQVQLKDGAAADISRWLNGSRWEKLERAQKSPLFDTPVKHFFVKAFLEEPLDEFLAHITTIEAALLLPTEKRGLTELVKKRVSKLLGDQSEREVYECLYNLRCSFVHGRRMLAIPGEARLRARRLARKVVNALVKAALNGPPPEPREAFLKRLGA